MKKEIMELYLRKFSLALDPLKYNFIRNLEKLIL